MNAGDFILIAALLCSTAVAVLLWLAGRQPAGRHTLFADPADRTDPYGAEWPPRAEPDDGFWDRVPGPSRDGALGTGTGQFPMLPVPDPDPTIVQSHEVAYLGEPVNDYLDKLFPEPAAAEGAAES